MIASIPTEALRRLGYQVKGRVSHINQSSGELLDVAVLQYCTRSSGSSNSHWPREHDSALCTAFGVHPKIARVIAFQ